VWESATYNHLGSNEESRLKIPETCALVAYIETGSRGLSMSGLRKENL